MTAVSRWRGRTAWRCRGRGRTCPHRRDDGRQSLARPYSLTVPRSWSYLSMSSQAWWRPSVVGETVQLDGAEVAVVLVLTGVMTAVSRWRDRTAWRCRGRGRTCPCPHRRDDGRQSLARPYSLTVPRSRSYLSLSSQAKASRCSFGCHAIVNVGLSHVTSATFSPTACETHTTIDLPYIVYNHWTGHPYSLTLFLTCQRPLFQFT